VSAAEAVPASPAERRALAGLPGLLLAAAGGGAAGLAHPPFGLWPALVGFALVLHGIDAAPAGRPLRAAFARGWAAGFAYFLIGTWWVGEAFMVDAAAHAWQAPFVVVLLPAGLGLFWGAAGLAYQVVRPMAARRILVFAALFALAEWLRGHVLTGFPWDLPGEAWKAGSAPSQAAAVLGAYGLSFVTLAIAAAPAVLLGTDAKRARLVALVSAAVGLAALWGGGALRLARPAPPDAALLVRVVQPDIPQAVKWTPEAFRAIVDRYVALTGAPAARRPDVVVWPEAAIPAVADELFAPGSWTAEAIAGALQPDQALLAGVVRMDGRTYYNSLLGLGRRPAGFAFLGVYDKHRLVPFGEYLPFEGLLSALGLKKLVAVEGGFAAGPEPAPVTFGALPRMQPLICYESLFPGFSEGDGARPSWIVNVSNDAWFGRTSGPWQHLNLASYRAIEEGLPMVRATPTGVSAVVDAFGRTRRSLGPGERGVIDAALPGALPPTLYARVGDAPFWLLTLAGLACALRRRRPAA
jgi:apolipoprotein N-acyltransferase